VAVTVPSSQDPRGQGRHAPVTQTMVPVAPSLRTKNARRSVCEHVPQVVRAVHILDERGVIEGTRGHCLGNDTRGLLECCLGRLPPDHVLSEFPEARPFALVLQRLPGDLLEGGVIDDEVFACEGGALTNRGGLARGKRPCSQIFQRLNGNAWGQAVDGPSLGEPNDHTILLETLDRALDTGHGSLKKSGNLNQSQATRTRGEGEDDGGCSRGEDLLHVWIFYAICV
jgi:hypothetical protein